MRIDKHILSYGWLIAALAYTLWFVFAGFGNHQDPLYWLYKYQTLEGGWMAAGTLLTGGALVRIFGVQLLPLRLVGWLCVALAIGLPYCCLLSKEQRRENLSWLALAYMLMGYGAFQEFSPGTLSVLLLSAIWVCAVKSPITNCQSPILTAILAGLAVSVRFPNVLVLLVLIPLWKKRSLWLVPLAALSAGIVYLLGYWLLTPAMTDAAMNSHEYLSMLTKLWENGGRLIGYMLLAVGVLACQRLVNIKPAVSGTIMGFVLVYFIAYTIKPFQWYNTDLTYLISAFCILLALAARQKEIGIGLALLCVATFGTDTAWLKLFPAVLCLLPVAATRFAPEAKQYLWCALMVVAVMVIVRVTNNSVGQSNLTRVQTVSTIAPYQGIAIREAEEKRLAQYIADYDSLYTEHHTPYTILALGQENHLMRAVTGCEAARFNEFWSNIYDSVYTAKYREIIMAERPIVFCSFSPQFKTKPQYKDKESRMEQMLLDEGYRVIDRSKHRYMIYIPEYDNEIQ